MTTRLKYTVVIISACLPAGRQGFIAYAPAIRGAVAAGSSRRRALKNLRTRVSYELVRLRERGETIPPDQDAPPWPKTLPTTRIQRIKVEVP